MKGTRRAASGQEPGPAGADAAGSAAEGTVAEDTPGNARKVLQYLWALLPYLADLIPPVLPTRGGFGYLPGSSTDPPGRPADASLYATATGPGSLAAICTIASPPWVARTRSRMACGTFRQAAVTLAAAAFPTDSLTVTRPAAGTVNRQHVGACAETRPLIGCHRQ